MIILKTNVDINYTLLSFSEFIYKYYSLDLIIVFKYDDSFRWSKD